MKMTSSDASVIYRQSLTVSTGYLRQVFSIHVLQGRSPVLFRDPQTFRRTPAAW